MNNRIKLQKGGEVITVWADQLAIMATRGWKEEKPKKAAKKQAKIIEIHDINQITEITEITEITQGEER
jgi:hypothetical protein